MRVLAADAADEPAETGAARPPQAAAEASAHEPSPKVRLTRPVAAAIVIIGIVSGVGALYFAKAFFLPIVIAFLLTLTLGPVVRYLSRRKIPAGATAALIVSAITVAALLAFYSLSGPVMEWVSQAPSMGQEIERKLQAFRAPVEAITQASDQVEEITGGTDGAQEVVVKEPGFMTTAASTVSNGLVTFFITIVLLLFFLATSEMFYEKLVRILPSLSDKKRALRIVFDVERVISRYLLTITAINAALGVAIGLCMWAIGMPNPILWGFAGAVLNFFPYVGAVLGVVMTAAVALVSFDEFGYAVLAPAAYLLCTIIEGQFVTPTVLGRRLEINVVAIFISVAFWGWLWGIPGVLIAVPVLICVKVFCDHFEELSAYSEFLSGTPPVMSPNADDAEAK